MRVALSTFGTVGDIVPFARLACALLARGHHVTVHTWEHYRPWFSPQADFAGAGGGVVETEVEQNLKWALVAPSFIEQVRRFGRLFYGLGDGDRRARAYYQRAREVLGGHQVAVINALDHVGQLAAEKVGIPWICYSSRPPPDEARADPVYAQVDAEVGRLVSELAGEQRRVRVFRRRSPLLTLAPCSPHLAGPADSADVELTGGWFDRNAVAPLPREVESFLERGPVLFVTFGTMPDINLRTRTLIAAARASGWRALVQALPPVAISGTVPEGIAVVTERLPFVTLLPRVAAVVHHGSVGTLHEVVRAGRPSLVVPHMGDQPFWGLMLHERGLAPAPVGSGEIELDVLTRRLGELRDPGYAARAAALSPRLAAEDGVTIAVRELEAVGARSGAP